MSKFRNYLLLVALLASVGAIIGSRARAWNKPESDTIPVTINLADIAKNPLALKGKSVTFIARFASRANMFKDKDEIFTRENYENFSAWNKEIKFWEESELKKAYPTFYIAKNAKEQIDKLRIINQFDKIEVTGVVESLYANMPWIRVTNIKVLKEDELDQSMASQVSRAVKFIDNNEFQKARICFEIAQERKVPQYVNTFISQKLAEIKRINSEKILNQKKLIAKHLLTQARSLAKSKKFEQAATIYGKSLKASNAYNTSADIHKEIAGFFIDFYRAKSDSALLEYSVNELKIAQKIIGQPDSDIYYALAYIETLKAKTAEDFFRAEALAKKCLEINSHHYNGRKLLSDIMSCQLTAQKEKIESIILPVAPKKRIKLRKPIEKEEDISVQIDDLISEKELLALAKEIKDIENPLEVDKTNIELHAKTNEQGKNNAKAVGIPGISANDFNIVLDNIESDLTEISLKESEFTQDNEPALPDFPVSFEKTSLPELAKK